MTYYFVLTRFEVKEGTPCHRFGQTLRTVHDGGLQ